MMSLVFFLLLAGIAAAFLIGSRRQKARELEERAEEMERVKKTVEEDVVAFGEEVADLDLITAGAELDEGGRQDYSRAIDEYDRAKDLLDRIESPQQVSHVTEAIEDGRYAAKCVRARVEGKPLPVRRPPCFFNPQHGPSVEDVDWAPVGGQPRPVPVCAADAERVSCGAEPNVRTVPVGNGLQRRAYWEAGPAYAEYNRGYFNSYAGSGLLPGVLMGAMMFGGFGGGWDGGMDGAGDMGGGDFGGDAGGDMGGGDFGGGDFGGDMGGGFDLGRFDF